MLRRALLAGASAFLLAISAVTAFGQGGTGTTADPSTGEIRGEVSGTVEAFDPDTGRLVTGGRTVFMPLNVEALRPRLGQKVTLLYEERDGHDVVVSFRQGQ
jgi:hypothetical protein